MAYDGFVTSALPICFILHEERDTRRDIGTWKKEVLPVGVHDGFWVAFTLNNLQLLLCKLCLVDWTWGQVTTWLLGQLLRALLMTLQRAARVFHLLPESTGTAVKLN